eukprot:1622037-Rhodomonas_salina.1
MYVFSNCRHSVHPWRVRAFQKQRHYRKSKIPPATRFSALCQKGVRASYFVFAAARTKNSSSLAVPLTQTCLPLAAVHPMSMSLLVPSSAGAQRMQRQPSARCMLQTNLRCSPMRELELTERNLLPGAFLRARCAMSLIDMYRATKSEVGGTNGKWGLHEYLQPRVVYVRGHC